MRNAAFGDPDWWKRAVIYEIYPRGFAETNGGGIGDLNGITEHLDHLEDPGVDAIWITPFYPSPQVDFAYDISDYEAIDPQYGTWRISNDLWQRRSGAISISCSPFPLGASLTTP
jgi:alpha-glucosidase